VNLLKSPLRRTSAVLAGALIGLTGAFAFAGTASAHTTDLQGTAACTDTGWKVDWVLNTHKAPKAGEIDVVEENPSGSDLTEFVVGHAVAQNGSVSETQTFGKDVSEVALKVTVVWKDGYKIDQGGEYGHPFRSTSSTTVKAPEGCQYPSPSPSPSPSESTPPIPTPGDAKPILEQTCDTITIGLDNPSDGVEVKIDYKTSKGETRTTTVKPGEKKAEKFSAKPGFTVTVTLSAKGEDSETVTIPYTQPDNCSGGGGGGGLPVTGAAAGTIAGGAALLLILGGVLFVVSRRRKVKFTA